MLVASCVPLLSGMPNALSVDMFSSFQLPFAAQPSLVLDVHATPFTRQRLLSCKCCGFLLPVICSKTSGSLRFLLAVWLLFEEAKPDVAIRSQKRTGREGGRERLVVDFLPPLVILSPTMLHETILSLKPLRTLDAVKLAQPWKVFCRFSVLVLSKLPRRAQVSVYLIDVSSKPKKLVIAHHYQHKEQQIEHAAGLRSR